MANPMTTIEPNTGIHFFIRCLSLPILALSPSAILGELIGQDGETAVIDSAWGHVATAANVGTSSADVVPAVVSITGQETLIDRPTLPREIFSVQ